MESRCQDRQSKGWTYSSVLTVTRRHGGMHAFGEQFCKLEAYNSSHITITQTHTIIHNIKIHIRMLTVRFTLQK